MKKAETFEELAEVAIGTLKKMSKLKKPIVQICGPVSTGGLGSIDKNLDRFNKAIIAAKGNGLQVFDQVPFEKEIKRISQKYPITNGYCMPILDVFYKKIFESGHIKVALFLPDWKSSSGATWERNLVTRLGIEVREYPQQWL